MYKMSWPDLACASAARVISALLPVKRSTWTSTFSFAAHSSINASQVLLAFGTKWSQKPIESLPAACAVLTNGAAIIVVDAAADVAMNRQRLNIFPLMVFAPFWCQGSKRVRKPAANEAIRSRLILSKLLRRDWQPAPSGPLYANQFVKGRRWQCQMPTAEADVLYSSVRPLDCFSSRFLLRDAAGLAANAGPTAFNASCFARFAILSPTLNLSRLC